MVTLHPLLRTLIQIKDKLFQQDLVAVVDLGNLLWFQPFFQQVRQMLKQDSWRFLLFLLPCSERMPVPLRVDIQMIHDFLLYFIIIDGFPAKHFLIGGLRPPDQEHV